MAEWKYTVFCLAAVFCGKVLSANVKWKGSLKVCKVLEQRPSTVEDDGVKNNTWMGKAKYVKSSGIITLQIQRIEENETCSDCGTLQKHCQFCVIPVQLNQSGSFFEELRTKLTPGQKYIIGDSWSSHVEEIPEPITCLVHRGASDTEYISCNNFFDDGCKKSENVPSYKAVIYLEENIDEGTSTYTSVVSSKETGGEKNEKCDFFLPNLEIIIIVGFFCILILINVSCVCCCVNCQVKRKLRSLRIQQMNDSPSKPISEAITRMYKKINAFKEEQYETYDLAANVINKSNFAITSGINDKDNYDNEFFRLLRQSGDYDMAWSNALSPVTSPDVEYDHVQSVGKLLMACLPEEDIYSKQSPLIQDISSDVNKMCNNGSDNVNECVSEKSTDSINGLSHVDERNLRSQTVANFQESDLNNIVGNDAHDNGTQQKKIIVYEENGAINQIHEKLSTTDETVVEKGKTRKDKKAGKSLEMQNGKRDVNVKKSKVHRESKTGKASNNLPECPLINEDTMKSSSQRAGKMVDKATSLLVANMKRVLSETKL